MKNLKSITQTYFLIIGCLVSGIVAKAQPGEIAYRAYVANSLSMWEQAIKKSPEASFDKALVLYGYLSATMADQDEEAFDKYYDQTVDLLEDFEDDKTYGSKSKALLSSIYGLSIAYDGWKGMFLGSKSSTLVDEAYAKSPDDPMVLKMYAGNKFYTPETFGGGPKLALESCTKSVELYESKGDTIKNWIYLDALALLGTMHRKAGDLDISITTYEKALTLEPDYGWVKYALLPSARKAKESK